MGGICPACKHENLLGSDRCDACFHSLMEHDLPHPHKDDVIQSAMMVAPVSELLTGKDLLVASPGDSVSKVVKIFQKELKNCILVYEKKKLVGILTYTDLLHKVTGKVDDLGKLKVADVMTTYPEFIWAEDTIAVAVHKMALGGFRHLPVLRLDGTPYSIIYIKDVLNYLTHQNRQSA